MGCLTFLYFIFQFEGEIFFFCDIKRQKIKSFMSNIKLKLKIPSNFKEIST